MSLSPCLSVDDPWWDNSIMHSPAGAARRLAAFAIDYVIVSTYAILLAIVSLQLLPSKGAGLSFSATWMFDALAFASLVLPVTLYFAVSEASSRGATVGKWRMRLAVVDADGSRLPFRRSLLRSALKFLPWQIAHTSLFHIPGWPTAVEGIPAAAAVGLVASQALVAVFVIGLLTPRRRTLYDAASGSHVVLKVT
jgi:uncharacterized RDD family membrane protein YckC